jgi:glycosyltransferase involved in cell wall biosynthesis
MRILIVAPWFRTLAHLYGRLLVNAGHDVMVVASDRHFEAGYGFCDEVSFGGKSHSMLTGGTIVQTASEVRRFSPEIVLEEPFNHPRWLAVPRNARRILMLHEPVPGRDSVPLDWRRRLVRQVQGRGISSVICFSQYAAAIARNAGWNRVDVVPLISEMPEEWVPTSVDSRRGFAVVGRISHNKGIDIAVDAWQGLDEEVRGREPLRLMLSEGEDQSASIDRWRRNGVSVHTGRFSFKEMVSEISRSRVMLLPYRSGMQSGSQVLAMQLGLVPIVSNVGGLPEYQPEFLPALTYLEVEQWTQQMLIELEIDDPAARSERVHDYYMSRFGSVEVVLDALQYVIFH